jgi:hypothetical protein
VLSVCGRPTVTRKLSCLCAFSCAASLELYISSTAFAASTSIKLVGFAMIRIDECFG